ncbi:collagenase [Plutella xylostella]|nr:collagenase [Plutella xylostella]
MKVLVGILLLAAVAAARLVSEDLTAFNYHEKIGFAKAASILAAEQSISTRIVGGSAAKPGDFKYQAGLVISIGQARSVCGGVLLSATRVLTAAHCWFDGRNQAQAFEVVLGSTLLFTGGQRVHTTDVQTHENWNPIFVRNDVAIARISAVTLDDNVQPIALPVGLTDNNFVGYKAVASGFGRTKDGAGIEPTQFLSYAWLEVIANDVCRRSFPINVFSSTICISGVNATSTCNGDSGGPLAVEIDNKRVLIGITSFGSAQGCENDSPAAFARITSFLPWIQARL